MEVAAGVGQHPGVDRLGADLSALPVLDFDTRYQHHNLRPRDWVARVGGDEGADDDRRPGRFLLLGSASPKLLQQASESLAGRISFNELAPFDVSELELTPAELQKFWLRGGYPLSWLAATEAASLAWRESFIVTHLERDIPTFGIRVPSTTLRRFWQMLAHLHGQMWNASRLAASFGVSAPTVQHYMEILEATYMIRRLPPLHANLHKRLVKSPKIYLRDSGLLHALLG